MQPPIPMKPFGAALEWSDEDLERLSQVTDTDVAEARQHWINHAPPRYKSLLDAIEVDDG